MTTENQISAPAELLAQIEQGWISRTKTQNAVPARAPTVKYLNAETEFFVGAMMALNALNYVASPSWVISIMSGQPIVSMERLRA